MSPALTCAIKMHKYLGDVNRRSRPITRHGEGHLLPCHLWKDKRILVSDQVMDGEVRRWKGGKGEVGREEEAGVRGKDGWERQRRNEGN